MRMEKVLIAFGTRPEAIKLAPVVRALRNSGAFEVKVCVTAQHREMLDQVLAAFHIQPDFDLDLMKPDQQLAELTAGILTWTTRLLRQWRPDLIIVQGDTTTTFAASLAAFYEKIPVAHIEAGLRSADRYSPWPEEINRCLTTVLATWHFAPTERARHNLLTEGINPDCVFVTGNTVVDALREAVLRLRDESGLAEFYDRKFSFLDPRKRLVLATGHRRENFGQRFRQICCALRELARRNDIEILYPVHLNPNVRGPVEEILGLIQNVHLVEPQEYLSFTCLLQRCYMIVTDSGGIQEEAPFLHKPVLLMRDTTERPEAVEVGAVKLVGSDVQAIAKHANELLDDDQVYRSMSNVANPFGDGYASSRILRHLELLKADTETTMTAVSSRAFADR
jgi:UDP-N-acetylglucosamine 2-epimerase (non-hydrolysing)